MLPDPAWNALLFQYYLTANPNTIFSIFTGTDIDSDFNNQELEAS